MPVPSSFDHSRTTPFDLGRLRAELSELADELHSQPLLVPLGIGRDPDGGVGEGPASRPEEGSGVEQVRGVAPGTSASMISSRPGTFSSRRPALLLPLFGVLRPAQRYLAVELEEAQLRVGLIDGALPEGSHLGGHLLVAGEQRLADGVEVIRQEVDVLPPNRPAPGRSSPRPTPAEQHSGLAVACPPTRPGLVEIPDRSIEGDDGIRGLWSTTSMKFSNASDPRGRRSSPGAWRWRRATHRGKG